MNVKFNISKRIALGYFIIIFIASVASIINIIRLQNNNVKYKEILNVYLPSVFNLKEFQALTKESNKLTVNWIYIANKEERDRLEIIENKDYPELRNRIESSSAFLLNPDLHNNQMALLNDYDKIAFYQKRIMRNLSGAEQYTIDSLVDSSINILEKEIKPRFARNQQALNAILSKESQALQNVEIDLNKSQEYLTVTMISMLILIIVIGTIASYVATKSIIRPINSLKDVIIQLGRGEIPAVKETTREDEIGEMTRAIKTMSESVQLKAAFATETGKENFDTHFELLSDKDILGQALLKMRGNLRTNAKEDADRNWLNIGLNKASDILRINETNATRMYADIINFLAEYIEATVATLYITDDHSCEEPHLHFVSGFGFNNTELKRKNILFGSGLTGQCASGKKTITLNSVPEGFLEITTSLGSAAPKSIIIVPLLFENEVKGVMEFASTTTFTELQKDFLEKNSKNIAITLALITRKERTEKLLVESRELNEKLKLNEIELKTANKELNTFIYRTSHDLRAPLTNILGLANLYTYDSVDQKEFEYIRMVDESAGTLDKILNSLIKTMSIMNKNLEITEINLHQMFAVMLESLKSEYSAMRIKFLTDIETDEPIFSDYELLKTALYNILENAVKFQNHSLMEPYVIVSVSKFEDGLKINISDNGIGVKKDLQSKIFEMFFRGTLRESGSGLGLYIVKKSIKKLNGKVEFSSKEGTGTLVSFYVPNLVVEQEPSWVENIML